MLARLSLEQIKSILKRGIFEELVKVMYSMVYVILVLLIFTGCNGLENWMKEDINEALVITAGKGNTSAVRTLLKRGADVNTVSYSTYFGITALGSAAYEGHLDTVRVLLSAKANPNGGEEGVYLTPLMRASGAGHTLVINTLVAAGADVNTKNLYGSSALMIAADENHITAMEALLDGGAELEVRDNYGETILMREAHKGNATTVQFLLKKGANINATTERMSDKTWLEHREWEVRSLAGGRFGLYKENIATHETALMLAAYMLHINIVNILLESRADVNMKEDQYGNTALTMAASVYVKDRTREYGAKRNEEASEEDRISIIKNLVEHGADINIRNKYGRTALSIASTRNSIYAVQILIDLGADVNIKDNDGDTALMMAMKYNQSTQKEGIVKLLKKSEAKK